MNKQYRGLIILILALPLNLFAQLPKADSLHQFFQRHDSIFFAKSFNQCDLSYADSMVHEDLIFYHDQSGVTDKAAFMAAIRNNICSNPLVKPIRKVLPESLAVFPLYENGMLYGVLQTGMHEFFLRRPGLEDEFTSIAKFSHVYVFEAGRWQLQNVISYDHSTDR